MFLHALLQRWRHTPAPPLPPRVTSWLANEDGRSLIAGLGRGRLIAQHDPSCRSLVSVWLPRKGSFTDLCELDDCPGCMLAFWVAGSQDDGLHFEPDSVQRYLDYGDEEFYDAWWCDCCWHRRSSPSS